MGSQWCDPIAIETPTQNPKLRLRVLGVKVEGILQKQKKKIGSNSDINKMSISQYKKDMNERRNKLMKENLNWLAYDERTPSACPKNQLIDEVGCVVFSRHL